MFSIVSGHLKPHITLCMCLHVYIYKSILLLVCVVCHVLFVVLSLVVILILILLYNPDQFTTLDVSNKNVKNIKDIGIVFHRFHKNGQRMRVCCLLVWPDQVNVP